MNTAVELIEAILGAIRVASEMAEVPTTKARFEGYAMLALSSSILRSPVVALFLILAGLSCTSSAAVQRSGSSDTPSRSDANESGTWYVPYEYSVNYQRGTGVAAIQLDADSSSAYALSMTSRDTVLVSFRASDSKMRSFYAWRPTPELEYHVTLACDEGPNCVATNLAGASSDRVPYEALFGIVLLTTSLDVGVDTVPVWSEIWETDVDAIVRTDPAVHTTIAGHDVLVSPVHISGGGATMELGIVVNGSLRWLAWFRRPDLLISVEAQALPSPQCQIERNCDVVSSRHFVP